MTKKEEIVNEILDNLDRLKKLDPNFTASLFLHGDASTDQITVCTKGNPEIINASFTSQLEKNPRFNQLMMSMLGAYIQNNPKEKEKLFSGMNLLELFPVSPN